MLGRVTLGEEECQEEVTWWRGVSGRCTLGKEECQVNMVKCQVEVYMVKWIPR